MKYIKSHFRFTKGQRNGIFLLFVIIIALQCLYFFLPNRKVNTELNQTDLTLFIKEIDSLKQLELAAQQPKLYPFNPNYISDFKGYTLGMTNDEIDRLLSYREQNKFVNSAAEFQKVTHISDSLLKTISPYFRFPEWVSNPKTTAINYFQNNTNKSFEQKMDLNKATAMQLQKVNGIGKVLSDRIVKFRNAFPDGFIADIQLQDIYGLSQEVIDRLTNEFTVKTPRQIIKYDINSVTVEELVTVQHIDYELAYEIIEQRLLRERYKSIEELTKVKGFPIDKLEIIKLYLTLK